jgi:hypothetical protein
VDDLWVQRNTDTPHLCPGCHGLAVRDWDRAAGPRTIMRCPRDCRVRWRLGVRLVGVPQITRWLRLLDAAPPRWKGGRRG